MPEHKSKFVRGVRGASVVLLVAVGLAAGACDATNRPRANGPTGATTTTVVAAPTSTTVAAAQRDDRRRAHLDAHRLRCKSYLDDGNHQRAPGALLL